MTAYVVCEGETDARLLTRLLPGEIVGDVKIVPAGGLYAAKSLARSLVVRRQSPVVIILDADSTVPEQVEQRLKETEEIIKNVAVNTPVKVALAAPSLELIFFQDVSLLSHHLGFIPDQDILKSAIYQPAQTLKQLISQSKNIQNQIQLTEQLTEEDLTILRDFQMVKGVIEFLQSVRETADVF